MKPIRTIREAREAIARVDTATKIYALIAVGILALLVGSMIGLAIHSTNEVPQAPTTPTQQVNPQDQFDDNIDGKPGYQKCYTYDASGVRTETFC